MSAGCANKVGGRRKRSLTLFAFGFSANLKPSDFYTVRNGVRDWTPFLRKQAELYFHPKNEKATNSDDSKDATSDTTVICVLIDGPAVSLNGSPTVSPMTADLCA